jgi:hypothetical protein
METNRRDRREKERGGQKWKNRKRTLNKDKVINREKGRGANIGLIKDRGTG